MLIKLLSNVKAHPSSYVGIVMALAIIVMGYFGVVDKDGPLEEAANKVISTETGIPEAQLEFIEGIGSGK